MTAGVHAPAKDLRPRTVAAITAVVWVVAMNIRPLSLPLYANPPLYQPALVLAAVAAIAVRRGYRPAARAVGASLLGFLVAAGILVVLSITSGDRHFVGRLGYGRVAAAFLFIIVVGAIESYLAWLVGGAVGRRLRVG